MKTLLLDRTTWDFVLDTNGDIAVASDPYSIAQDIASACRLFMGELWYDQTKGVVYNRILGKFVSLEFVKAQLVKAALSVPQVQSAIVVISGFEGRTITGGQIQFTYSTTTAGSTTANILTGNIVLTEDGGLEVAL